MRRLARSTSLELLLYLRKLQEFSIDIPHNEADEIQTVQQGELFSALDSRSKFQPFAAIDYIARTPEGTPVALRLLPLAYAAVLQLTNRRHLNGFASNAAAPVPKMSTYYPYLALLDPIQSTLTHTLSILERFSALTNPLRFLPHDQFPRYSIGCDAHRRDIFVELSPPLLVVYLCSSFDRDNPSEHNFELTIGSGRRSSKRIGCHVILIHPILPSATTFRWRHIVRP